MLLDSEGAAQTFNNPPERAAEPIPMIFRASRLPVNGLLFIFFELI